MLAATGPQILARMAAKKAQSPAMAFLVAALKTNKKAAYADIKAKADKKKLKLYPVMFGRAQAMLGIVKSAKRGTGKTAKAGAAKTTKRPGKRGRHSDPTSKSGKVRALLKSGMTTAQIAKKAGCTIALVYNIKSKAGGAAKGSKSAKKRGSGRPPKAKGTGSMDALGGILAAVKDGEKERVRMRAALEKIQAVIRGALG